MKKIKIIDILNLIQDYETIGDSDGYITELLPVNQAKETSLVFIDKNRAEKEKLISIFSKLDK